MARIHLVHWHAAEAEAHAERLRAFGHQVGYEPLNTPEALKRLRQGPPDLFLICLDRLPSHGRQVAGGLREFKATRSVPVLLVGGEPAKVARVREMFPELPHTEWRRIGTEIKRAMANPPSLAPLPSSSFPGYSGTPLPKKLGIKPGSVVALHAAPPEFPATLGPLPEGARLRANPRGKRDLTIWFVGSLKQLRAAVPRLVEASKYGGVWVAWPKKTSRLQTDISEREVRELGLAAGLVDHKICAIDHTWSGLRFALRK